MGQNHIRAYIVFRVSIVCLIGFLLILGITACGTATNEGIHDESGNSPSSGESPTSGESEGNKGELDSDGFILTYFMEADDEHIRLNISEARAEYMIEERGADGVDAMLYALQVKKTDDLDIVNSEGESLSIEELHEGDKVYVDYDMEDYLADTGAIVELDQLVVEDTTPGEMIQRFAPPEGDQYYVGIVHRQGEGWGEYDEMELEHY